MSFEQNSIAITETLRMIQLLDLIKSYHYSNQPNIEKNKFIEHKSQLQRQHSKVIESINEVPVPVLCFDTLNKAMKYISECVNTADLSVKVSIYKITARDVFLSLQRMQYMFRRQAHALAFIPEMDEPAYNNRDARDEDGYPVPEHWV